MSGNVVQADPMLPHSTKFCKCGVCGEYFTAVGSFDMHRTGPPEARKCIPPGEVRRKESGKRVLALDERGYWYRVG